MSLTKNDLKAIEQIIDRRVPVVVKPLLDDLDESISQKVAKGFKDVYRKIDGLTDRVTSVEETVKRIESVQQAELERNDHQDADIKKIRKALHAA